MSTIAKLAKLISSRRNLHHSRRSLSAIASSSAIPARSESLFPSQKCLAWRYTPTRLRVTRSGNTGPPTEMAPLFPGCDYKHWLIVMDKPAGDGASKQQIIHCYVQTLAKVLGSEEEARMKIYNVSCERYFGFGCEIEEEIANKMEDFPGVLFVLPDSYVDPENQDYGAELFVNGEIVQRSPERQRRVEPQPQRDRQRPSSPRPRRRM